ncbi:MAG: GTPase [Nanoarchaeota archaeon]|nr:GTPase [Nanoarchaeota archaeon]
MTLNATPEYKKANEKYLAAKTDEERLVYLDEMIRLCPKHKSSENMLANLKTRYRKLQEKILKVKKMAKAYSKAGIKKEEMQCVIIGFTNSGKSSLLNELTNVNTKAAESSFAKFTTKKPIIGMMPYSGTQVQIIENPAPDSEDYDKGLTNSADTILLLINSLDEINKLKSYIEKASGKKIIIYNKSDLLNTNEKRKLEATLKSKKYNFVIISSKTHEGLNELKDKIFSSFSKIRVFTKEPGKLRSEKPIILQQDSTVYNVAEKIFHGFSKQVKEAFVTGPSSKFPYQKVGLKHNLKDLDTIEFRTK